jgi:hypothetical protein
MAFIAADDSQRRVPAHRSFGQARRVRLDVPAARAAGAYSA